MKSDKDNNDCSSETGILLIVTSHIEKPFIGLALFCAYFFYVNYFGVVAFFSLNMFLIPLMVLVFAIWGLIVSFSLRNLESVDAKIVKFFSGLTIAAIPFLLFTFGIGNIINEAGISRKVRKYDKQLVNMCERIEVEKPERMHFSLREYGEFNIWAFGARPTREYGYHKNGVVYLDFNGSPDDGSGIIYNPERRKIDFHESNFYHMFGPWYRFKVSYD